MRSAFAPVPVLTADYFEREVVGAEMLDRLAGAVFEDERPGRVLHDRLSQELVTDNGSATLRVDVPFAERGDLSLKKIGLEVIVRVGGQKRTIMLPPALAAYATAARASRTARWRSSSRRAAMELSDLARAASAPTASSARRTRRRSS